MPEPGGLPSAARSKEEETLGQREGEAYDFSGIGTLVDVGGGHGTLLATILQRHPTVQGVLFERPQVAAGAGRVLDATGVRDRVAVQSRIPPFPL